MPLGQCPDCGRPVSTRAPACPHCGGPLPPAVTGRVPDVSVHGSEPSRRRQWKWSLLPLGLGVLFCLPYIVHVIRAVQLERANPPPAAGTPAQATSRPGY
jgi:hypothetical protein